MLRSRSADLHALEVEYATLGKGPMQYNINIRQFLNLNTSELRYLAWEKWDYFKAVLSTCSSFDEAVGETRCLIPDRVKNLQDLLPSLISARDIYSRGLEKRKPKTAEPQGKDLRGIIAKNDAKSTKANRGSSSLKAKLRRIFDPQA